MRKIITIIGAAAAAAAFALPATPASAATHPAAGPDVCAGALAGYCGDLVADNGNEVIDAPGFMSASLGTISPALAVIFGYQHQFAFLPSSDTADNGKVAEQISGGVATGNFWRENSTHQLVLVHESLAAAKADPASDLVYTGGCAKVCDGPFEVAGSGRLVSLPPGIGGGTLVTVATGSAAARNVNVTFAPSS